MTRGSVIPGFAAEAAVDRPRGPHVTVARPGAVTTGVHPQLAVRWPGQCDPSCICVTPEGCPCCVTFDPSNVNPWNPFPILTPRPTRL